MAVYGPPIPARPSSFVANSGNYDLSYQGNNLTITKALLNVIADAKTKVYGDAPALGSVPGGVIPVESPNSSTAPRSILGRVLPVAARRASTKRRCCPSQTIPKPKSTSSKLLGVTKNDQQQS